MRVQIILFCSLLAYAQSNYIGPFSINSDHHKNNECVPLILMNDGVCFTSGTTIFRTSTDQTETFGCRIKTVNNSWCLTVSSHTRDTYSDSDSFVTCDAYCLLGNIMYDNSTYHPFTNDEIASMQNSIETAILSLLIISVLSISFCL
jgi:hypothetical protein